MYVSYINATADSVWTALTDPEFTRLYWGGRRIQSQWRVGAAVEFVRDDGGLDWSGEVLEADRPRRLSYTFHMEITDAHKAERPSRVTFDLESVGPVVKLTLTHDELGPDSRTFETTRYGWPAIMSSLKSLLETGSPLPFSGLGFGPSFGR